MTHPPQPTSPGWRSATHLSHLRTSEMGGFPARFLAACGAIVLVTTAEGAVLPRCVKCAQAERRMLAATRTHISEQTKADTDPQEGTPT